ncbi:MAG TPA: sugar ABC transporter ATP-binding protein [Candidatus Udaeobacter sp.]|nr:sugar ABC transporter ATP-binding protein [Candidatus Udaeobacter sp.]
MSKQNENFLVINHVAKRFGVVTALQDVSFSVSKGEIHTLLGENGAGKSTLIKIIMGEQAPDSGSIIIDGMPVDIYTPKHAQSLGISMVHQELAVFENMTVAENIFPDSNFKNEFGLIDKRRLNSEAKKTLDIFELNIDPDQKMNALTLAEQQMVEILRAISLNKKIIMLDEPTSSLNNEEAERLVKILKKLRNDGITIIYISHRLNEILDLSDRVTVLRDGSFICTLINDESLTENILVSKMVGRELTGSVYVKKDYESLPETETIFEVKGLSKKNSVNNISFSLNKGEILGFYGLEGSGTTELSRMLYGLEGIDKGEFFYKGKKLVNITPINLIEHKILYLNSDRKHAGLLLNMSAMDNMSLPVLKKLSKFSFVDVKALKQYTTEFINKFSIAIASIWTKPGTLSGGNQQKLMLSVCLGTEPECFIINEPTRGIDVGAKTEIHKFILNIAKQGVSMIVFSSDLPELISLADRIIIMRNKTISGELGSHEITENEIMSFAAL